VILLGVMIAGLTADDEECSVVEIKNMQGEFRNCSRRSTEEHFNSEMVDTCELVKSVVESCGELWNRCYTIKEVRRMRDLHIEALVRQYGELGELDGCDLVQEYRQSGRTLADPVEDVTCSDDKTREIQTKFQTCSHSTATSVYQTIQDITSVKIISHKLCKALTTIGTVCIKHLHQCFAEDDVKQMRKSHLEEMKTFLLRISEEKVTNNVFENCAVMEYVENEEQEGIVLPELGDNTVDMAFESEEEDEVENTQDNGDDNSVQSVNTERPDNNIEAVERDISESDSVLTTTEDSSTILVKGARSVDYVETNITLSANSETQSEHPEPIKMHKTDKKQITEIYEDLKNELHADNSDEVATEKDDKVVGDKVEGSDDISPEEYTSGGGGVGRQTMSAIVSIITVITIERLW